MGLWGCGLAGGSLCAPRAGLTCAQGAPRVGLTCAQGAPRVGLTCAEAGQRVGLLHRPCQSAAGLYGACMGACTCRDCGRVPIATVCYSKNIDGAENFPRRPGATTFSSDVLLLFTQASGHNFQPWYGHEQVRAVLPFFTQASGHNFQPCCGPVFKTRADSGPCGMLIATLFFFFQFCMQARGHVFQPCYGHEPEQGCAAFVHTGHTDRKQYLKTVLASCVVPVYCLSFGVQ